MTTGMSNPPVYPHGWREIVNGSVEENFAPIALGTLNSLVREEVIPPTEHIQLLLYLCLNPTAHSVPPSAPFDILYRLLSFHSPSSFATSLPSHPSSSQLRSEETPKWLDWDYRRSELHRQVWRTLKRCRDEGVWALLWESDGNKGKGKGKMRRVDENADMEEEEQGQSDRVVSEVGWRILEWLVKLWEQDESEQQVAEGQIPHSRLLLRQLPRPYDRNGDLQRNDATIILAIVRSALLAQPSKEKFRRETDAIKLLKLLFHTALSPQPPFHPSSLTSSLVHFFRSLPVFAIQRLSQILASELDVEWFFLAHIYALVLEDMGGIRSKKVSQRRAAADRRRRKNVEESKNESDFEKRTNGLGEPTLRYVFAELLPLNVAIPVSKTITRNSSKEDGVDIETREKLEKIVTIKLALINLFLKTWEEVSVEQKSVVRRYKGDELWKKEVKESLMWSTSTSKGNEEEERHLGKGVEGSPSVQTTVLLSMIEVLLLKL
nr:uncharacterized protein CI109_005104 [Kwoniella shandongensis]KAA5526530.1 hypothetical protein CI109_005104 [Kwoniella shandongensis]